AEPLRRALRRLRVELPVVVLRPRVEAERGDDALLAATHHDGSFVARPAAIARPAEDVDLLRVDAAALHRLPRLGAVLRRRHDQPRALALRDAAEHLAVHPRDRRELARPVALVRGPAEPRRFVRLPLAGHPERSHFFAPGGTSRKRCSIPAYASMRRSRRNG